MKITMNVDCTPEEARAFLGLPDLKPIQEEIMGEMRERMMAAVHSTDPTEMLRMWTTGSMSGFDQMRDFFEKMSSVKRDK